MRPEISSTKTELESTPQTEKETFLEKSGPARSALRRQQFLDALAMWEGGFNRADLERRFGVSTAQASLDVRDYLEAAGAAIAYDKTLKRYVTAPDFAPVFTATSPARMLGELRLLGLGVLTPDEMTTLGTPPPFDATPVPERALPPRVVALAVQAIRGRRQLACRYQSMSRPEPAPRMIEPHALAHDGFRWHVRAFDRESASFRDFVLGRMSEAALGDAATARAEDDRDWQTRVTLKIVPHPGLTPSQAAAIRADYAFTGEVLELSIRRALLLYALKRLGLDLPPNARPPQEQHIVLANRDEVVGVRGA